MKIKLEAQQGGFSLIEVIVATVILTFGLLAMAASTGYVAAQMNSAKYDTERTAARSRMVEQLRATTYANIVTNTNGQSVGRYTMRWNVTTDVLQKRIDLITSGPGYRGSSRARRITVVDTMSFSLLAP